LTKVINSKDVVIDIPQELISLFVIEKKKIKGLSPEGIKKITVYLDGTPKMSVKDKDVLKILLENRKKSDRTPKEQVAYEILVAERLKKKMISQLIEMQHMWIKMHRISEKEIRSYDDNELRVQYQMHDTLWSDYIIKPKAPKLCESCGVEVGRCEVLIMTDGKQVQYNDKCRECYDERQ
jgi:organic radical activating enzyme